MKLRAALTLVVAMFQRPHWADPIAPIEIARVQETQGLVSEASAFRIRTALSRFARFCGGGG